MPKQILFRSVPINLKKAKSPLYLVPVPDAWNPYLGQIAVLWGVFESTFDDFLLMMFKASKTTPEKNWQRTVKGNKRRKMILDQATLCFAQHPTVNAFIRGIIADSEPLGIRRNVLLHGKLHLWLKGEERILVGRGAPWKARA